MATLCDLNEKKPKINYPCNWNYKLIVIKGVDLKKILRDRFGDKKYSLKLSNESKSGKYESYNFVILVNNEQQREEYFSSLKENEFIKFVL